MAIEIGAGVEIGGGTAVHTALSAVTTGLVLQLDAATLSANPTTWTDSVSSLTFTLYGAPVYSSAHGGVLQFVPASSQYAQSPTQSFASLTQFTVEAWHYYTGTNSAGSPCILTELYPGSTARINFNLGNGSDSSPNLQMGFFDGGWRQTTTGYTLTAGNWYHLMGTYDGATIRLYVNNSLVRSTAYSGTPVSSRGGIRLMRRWDAAQYQGGYLGIVRIYNTALSAADVSVNYSADRSRFGL